MNTIPRSGAEAQHATDIKARALRYIDACGKGELDAVADLLSPDLEFRLGERISDKPTYLAALKRLGLIWRGSAVNRLFMDGDDVAVFYDIVTDTPVGAVPSAEWLTFQGGQIRSIRLIFEQGRWSEVQAEVQRRAAGS